MIKKWCNSDIAVLIKRLLIVYAALMCVRVVFYICNADIIGTIGWSELWSLFTGAIQFDSVSIIYAHALFIVLSLLPLRSREMGWYQLILKWYYIVVNSAVMAVNMCDVVYFRYTQSRFSAQELFFFENDNTLDLVWKFAAENWYLFIIWVVIVVAMVWLYRRCGAPVTPIRHRWAYYTVNSIVLLATLTLSLWIIRGCSLSRDVRPITVTNATAYTSSSAKATMILSNPFSILRTMGTSSIKSKHYFSEQELDEIYTPYHYPQSDTLSFGGISTQGILKGRNVVIFILESFSAEHSALLNPDLYPDGRGYTPFLDSLMRGGYVLRNAFATGRKSIDALPSVWSSIPSYRTPFVLLPQALKDGEQMPEILKNEGYKTMFFNGSPRGSMGFDAYARGAGVEKLYSMEDYNEHHEGNYDGYWGVWDEPFIGYMGEVLSQTQQPFMSTIFTLTSHHPFVVPDKYRDSLPEGRTQAHKPVAYTDMSIRKFFEMYGGCEWFANTTFVFVGDHVSSERFAPKTETTLGKKHVMMFIYTPDGVLRGDDNMVFQQTDIMPTMLGLMGYDKPYFAFGRDIFNEPERMALAVNYDGVFQGVSDSMVVLFDEDKVIGAYARTDTLQQNNLTAQKNEHLASVEKILKAQIQQYYRQLGRTDKFVAPPR